MSRGCPPTVPQIRHRDKSITLNLPQPVSTRINNFLCLLLKDPCEEDRLPRRGALLFAMDPVKLSADRGSRSHHLPSFYAKHNLPPLSPAIPFLTDLPASDLTWRDGAETHDLGYRRARVFPSPSPLSSGWDHGVSQSGHPVREQRVLRKQNQVVCSPHEGPLAGCVCQHDLPVPLSSPGLPGEALAGARPSEGGKGGMFEAKAEIGTKRLGEKPAPRSLPKKNEGQERRPGIDIKAKCHHLREAILSPSGRQVRGRRRPG